MFAANFVINWPLTPSSKGELVALICSAAQFKNYVLVKSTFLHLGSVGGRMMTFMCYPLKILEYFHSNFDLCATFDLMSFLVSRQEVRLFVHSTSCSIFRLVVV